jgi:hypothetical protein
MLEPILEKLSPIASGATTIGSTGHAPDDDRKHRLRYRQYQPKRYHYSTTIGRDMRLVEKTTQRFFALKQSNKAEVIKIVILELRHRDKT